MQTMMKVKALTTAKECWLVYNILSEASFDTTTKTYSSVNSVWSEKELLKCQSLPTYCIYGGFIEQELCCVIIYLCIGGDEAELLNIACAKKHMRKGYATYLLAQTIHRLTTQKGIRTFFLEVSVYNDRAFALYTKQGFQKIARRKNYYYDSTNHTRIDAFIMRKSMVSTISIL